MPPIDFLRYFNWIDVLVITIILRTTYSGFRHGLVVEFFKIFGVILTCYFVLHFYSGLGAFIARYTPIHYAASMVLSYLGIFVLLSFCCVLIRHSLLSLVTVDMIYLLKCWGGAVIGILRGLLLASFACLFLLIINIGYFKGIVNRSYSGITIASILPNTYKAIFDNVIVKFNPVSKFNFDSLKTLEAE